MGTLAHLGHDQGRHWRAGTHMPSHLSPTTYTFQRQWISVEAGEIACAKTGRARKKLSLSGVRD